MKSSFSRLRKPSIFFRSTVSFVFILFFVCNSHSQCNWSTIYYDNFEYTYPIPAIVPGTTYGNGTPQIYAAHSGSLGMYLNIVDNFSGMIYSQSFNEMCPEATYKVSFWVKDAFISSNDLTFTVLDDNNNLLSTTNVVTNYLWQFVELPVFVSPTTTFRFQIVSNIPGGPGNDAAIDELNLSICNPPSENFTLSYCSSQGNVDLYDILSSSFSPNGTWTGPSDLSNNYQGTFIPGSNVSGSYTYSIDGGTCTDSTGIVQVTLENQLIAGSDSLAYLCSTASSFSLSSIRSTNSSGGGTWESLSSAFNGTIGPNGNLSLTNTSGTYNFEYVVLGTSCPNDTAFFQLIVNQQPFGEQDQSFHLCNSAGSVVDFTSSINNSSEPISGYWELGANVPSGNFSSATNSFNLSGLPNGYYLFDYILPADTMCVADTVHIDLKVTEVPVAEFSVDITSGCQPVVVQFTNLSNASGNTVYNWSLGDGSTSTSSSTFAHQYDNAGCYDITLSVISDSLCSSSYTQNDLVCVYKVPVADFVYGPQQVYSDGPIVQFTNQSIAHQTSFWDFGDTETSTLENPKHEYPIGEIGDYTVQLIVQTQFGCTDTVSKIIVVKDQLLFYVPNTFTPDGDEFNPVFKPVMTAGVDLFEYQLQIYNRWGELLFESYDYNVGWDGVYHDNILKPDIYTWKLTFGLQESDGKMTSLGYVNLLR